MYNKNQSIGYSNIGLVRGALTGNENTAIHPSMVTYIVESANTTTIDVYEVNTERLCTKYKIPVNLQDNNIYEISFVSDDGFKSTKCILKSNTDMNFSNGVVIATLTNAPTKGYATNNFNDATIMVE